jgi:F0F1-type ATP synthase assembly protein I
MRSRLTARIRDVHRKTAALPSHCNNFRPSFAPRHTGAPRKIAMEFVALVMLGSVVLFLLQQFEGSRF